MDQAAPEDRGPGLRTAAERLASGLLGLARTRIELASVELGLERQRVTTIAVFAIAGAVLATLAVAALSILVVAYFWDTHRYWAIAGLALVYAALAAVAFARVVSIARAAPGPFAATIAEFEKDRALFGREPPAAP